MSPMHLYLYNFNDSDIRTIQSCLHSQKKKIKEACSSTTLTSLLFMIS